MFHTRKFLVLISSLLSTFNLFQFDFPLWAWCLIYNGTLVSVVWSSVHEMSIVSSLKID